MCTVIPQPHMHIFGRVLCEGPASQRDRQQGEEPESDRPAFSTIHTPIPLCSLLLQLRALVKDPVRTVGAPRVIVYWPCLAEHSSPFTL